MLQVRFAGWEYQRIVRMSFLTEDMDEELDIININNADLEDVQSVDDTTVVTVSLGRFPVIKSGRPSFTFQINPPPRKAPKIVCHPDWSPPPPTPSPRPPPPPPWPSPMPPPPPDEIQGQGCPGRASAKVEHFMAEGAHHTLRIVARPGPGSTWDAGSEVTIGFRGKLLAAAHTVSAAPPRLNGRRRKRRD